MTGNATFLVLGKELAGPITGSGCDPSVLACQKCPTVADLGRKTGYLANSGLTLQLHFEMGTPRLSQNAAVKLGR